MAVKQFTIQFEQSPTPQFQRGLPVKYLCAVAALCASIPAHAQFTSVVFDPTQAGHAIEQIAQGENILHNSVILVNDAERAYSLATQAYQLEQYEASSPASIYRPFISPSTYWQILNVAANTYGNSQPVMAAANTGADATGAYQLASVPRTAMIPEYGILSAIGQLQIAAVGATTDLSDAVVTSSLSTLGTMRGNEIVREADIERLESQSQSLDPLQATELATMQRVNQGTLMVIRQLQEANQLQQAIALHQVLLQKQQQDAIKSHFLDAQDYGTNFTNNIAPVYLGSAAAMTY